MELHTLKKIKGNKNKAKRRGRGIGSGKGGHTTGSGIKGQKSRSGNSLPFGFEGGQVPLYKKLPQIGGFKSKKIKPIAVTLSVLNLFVANSQVTPNLLVAQGIVKKPTRAGVKLLGSGTIEKKLTIKGFILTPGAKEKLEKADCVILG